MKPLIYRPDVEKAIETLKISGKNPTIKAIHAMLGGRGSITTLVRFKAEIDAEAAAQQDSQEGLRIFREFWKVAVQEGHKQKEIEIEQMRETIDALATEMQVLERASATACETVTKLQTQRDNLVAELTRMNEEVAAARAASEQNARKFGDSAERLTTLGSEIVDIRRQLSARESELARANDHVMTARASADHFSGQLAEALEKVDTLRSAHLTDTAQLRTQLGEEQQRSHALEIALARLETRMENHKAAKDKSHKAKEPAAKPVV